MKISKVKLVIYILVLAAAVFAYVYFKNSLLHVVTLDTKGPAYKLFSSSDKNKVIATVDGKTTVKLHDGYYCAEANDDKYETHSLCFMVYKTDTEFVFESDYSSDYLSKLLVPEKKSIDSIINTTYPDIGTNYIVCGGELYGKGNIYGSVIVQKKFFPRDSVDSYRIVLQKKNNKWGVVNNPVIVLDKTTFSDIPVNILKKINTLTVCES
jgi:hypothetical protein